MNRAHSPVNSQRLGLVIAAGIREIELFSIRDPAWAAHSGLLAACRALPPRSDQADSYALTAPADSPLVHLAQASVSDPSLSGFRLLPIAAYALDTRIELVRRARNSLDVQYYLIENDRSGRLLMRNLRDAALRGV